MADHHQQDIAWPDAPCCAPDYPGGCVCLRAERALRAWSDLAIEVPMTAEQRAFCLDEIGSVEGYDRTAHQSDEDSELARATICAWTDYCRDKGLL